MPAIYTNRKNRRLTHNAEYQAAYAARLKKSAGPLTVFGRPNGLDTHRLGLGVGRRVGPAFRRSRIKRLLREAFRLNQAGFGKHDQAGNVDAGNIHYDFVVRVHPHDLAPLADYETWLCNAVLRVMREHRKRLERQTPAE